MRPLVAAVATLPDLKPQRLQSSGVPMPPQTPFRLVQLALAAMASASVVGSLRVHLWTVRRHGGTLVALVVTVVLRRTRTK